MLAELVASFKGCSRDRSCWSRPGRPFRAIDPVRGITSHSSGKMGFRDRAPHAGRRRGHAGGGAGAPTHAAGRQAHRRAVGAADARCGAGPKVDQASIFIAAAAVADWRPASAAEHKIRRTAPACRPRCISSEPDILAGVAASEARQEGPALLRRLRRRDTRTCWPTRRPKRARKAECRCWSATSANHLQRDDNALLLVDAQGAAGGLPHGEQDRSGAPAHRRDRAPPHRCALNAEDALPRRRRRGASCPGQLPAQRQHPGRWRRAHSPAGPRPVAARPTRPAARCPAQPGSRARSWAGQVVALTAPAARVQPLCARGGLGAQAAVSAARAIACATAACEGSLRS